MFLPESITIDYLAPLTQHIYEYMNVWPLANK